MGVDSLLNKAGDTFPHCSIAIEKTTQTIILCMLISIYHGALLTIRCQLNAHMLHRL